MEAEAAGDGNSQVRRLAQRLPPAPLVRQSLLFSLVPAVVPASAAVAGVVTEAAAVEEPFLPPIRMAAVAVEEGAVSSLRGPWRLQRTQASRIEPPALS